MAKTQTLYKALKPEKVNIKTWNAVVEAWQNGLSDREAAFRASKYADVHVKEADIKRWIKANPDIGELRDHLHSELLSAAKLTIAEKINAGDVRTAKWYLERKAASEFSTKSAVAFENEAVTLSLEEKERQMAEFMSQFGGDKDGKQ